MFWQSNDLGEFRQLLCRQMDFSIICYQFECLQSITSDVLHHNSSQVQCLQNCNKNRQPVSISWPIWAPQMSPHKLWSYCHIVFTTSSEEWPLLPLIAGSRFNKAAVIWPVMLQLAIITQGLPPPAATTTCNIDPSFVTLSWCRESTQKVSTLFLPDPSCSNREPFLD